MAIIDEKGAKAISGWFKEKQDIPHVITITDDKNPLMIRVDNDREKATLELIFMRNGIKYKVDNIKFSDN